MSKERIIRRYSAFFRGWATAFGAHEKVADDPRGLIWLFGEDQLGLILTKEVKRFLYPLFFGKTRNDTPEVSLGAESLRIADAELAFGEGDRRPLERAMDLLHSREDVHFSQTYHLIYPSGTRILTLGRRAPLALVYREIAPMRVQLR